MRRWKSELQRKQGDTQQRSRAARSSGCFAWYCFCLILLVCSFVPFLFLFLSVRCFFVAPVFLPRGFKLNARQATPCDKCMACAMRPLHDEPNERRGTCCLPLFPFCLCVCFRMSPAWHFQQRHDITTQAFLSIDHHEMQSSQTKMTTSNDKNTKERCDDGRSGGINRAREKWCDQQ